jgi:chromosome segregation protein
MRLNQIKMAGFKSFVDPTSISFPSDLVGVVGPNGCGKSNIIDAVRWVMGESSKHLRGGTMEDVIFNGSTDRKPVGQASIELVFDNSDGQTGGQFAHYSEIALRRSVSRDGHSKYYLNGSNCRRRDVVDIFLGTGLGPRSYAIIEQGIISRLIEARPEELRVYLEEAAGISKYKERRRETENRMRHARENISRLDDVREEVDKQINHLQRQAKTAEKYQALKREEHKAQASLLALRWRYQAREAAAREQTVIEKHIRQEQAMTELRGFEARIERLRVRYTEANEKLNEVQARYYKSGGDIARNEQAIQHHKALRARQQQELDQLQHAWQAAETEARCDRDQLAQLACSIAAAEPELEHTQSELTRYAAELATAEQAMAEWQIQSDALTCRTAGSEQTAQVERARIEHLERQLAQINERQTRLRNEQQQLLDSGLKAEIKQLGAQAALAKKQVANRQQQLKDALEAMAAHREQDRALGQRLADTRKRLQQISGRLSALEILQEAALGKYEQGVVQWLARHGLAAAPRLAEQLNVAAGWEQALETVLGPTLEAVCVENLEVALPVLEALPQGWLQLIDTREGGSVSATIHASIDATLLSKVDAPPVAEKLAALGCDPIKQMGQIAMWMSALRSVSACRC